MKFSNFIREGKARKIQKDYQLIKSLVSSTDKDIMFLENIKINDLSARKVAVNLLRCIKINP
ncbi:MAG: hypothetical protein ABIH25_01135 [Candidatus Woesearchaeota archaeon]